MLNVFRVVRFICQPLPVCRYLLHIYGMAIAFDSPERSFRSYRLRDRTH